MTPLPRALTTYGVSTVLQATWRAMRVLPAIAQVGMVLLLALGTAALALALIGAIFTGMTKLGTRRASSATEQSVAALLDTASAPDECIASMGRGDIAAAEQCLRATLATTLPSGASARAWLALAYVLALREYPVEAAEAYATALRVDCGLRGACVRLGAGLARAGLDGAAELALVAALAVAPAGAPSRMMGTASPEALADSFQAHATYGQMLHRWGRLDDAAYHLRAAVALRPNDAEAHDRYGMALEALGRVSEALSEYELGTRLAPDQPAAHAHLGGLLLRQERLEPAREHLRRATALAPERPTAHAHLATLHLKTGQAQEAWAEASAALAIRPDCIEAHLAMGQASLRLSHLADAERSARQAIELAPARADAFALLGYVLTAQGRPVEALLHFRQALRCAPDFPALLRATADALAQRGLDILAAEERQHALWIEQSAELAV